MLFPLTESIPEFLPLNQQKKFSKQVGNWEFFLKAELENIHNGFVALAKAAKADIVPVSISGFDGYAKHLFEKHITVTIGKPISYELATEEIVQQWCAEICKNTGFENCMLPEKSSC